jgi:hypothetical protein
VPKELWKLTMHNTGMSFADPGHHAIKNHRDPVRPSVTDSAGVGLFGASLDLTTKGHEKRQGVFSKLFMVKFQRRNEHVFGFIFLS